MIQQGMMGVPPPAPGLRHEMAAQMHLDPVGMSLGPHMRMQHSVHMPISSQMHHGLGQLPNQLVPHGQGLGHMSPHHPSMHMQLPGAPLKRKREDDLDLDSQVMKRRKIDEDVMDDVLGPSPTDLEQLLTLS